MFFFLINFWRAKESFTLEEAIIKTAKKERNISIFFILALLVLVEFDPSKGVVIDIENVQLGWLKLSGGRDWVEWPNNDPTNTPKP